MKTIVFAIILALVIYPLDIMASSGGVPFKTPYQKGGAPDQERAVEEKQQKTEDEKRREKQRVLMERKKASLNNTEWEIEIVSLGGKRRTTTKDTILFKEGKVSIATLLKKGFSPTNYTLTIRDNGALIWETMQTAKKDAVAFIRGEITPDTMSMKGIISYPGRTTSDDYSFRSITKRIARP